ncbi:hypothetical protein A4A49_11745 [Nicotiana attenuata]|uniref:Uncharacterized protein n=1 Tax=Nicotiana attenuata TaxID=49451 RepID=A0A314L876_NICAT|nr:hypothetical protein A4A49_11745 [Nicotiana attenuata]
MENHAKVACQLEPWRELTGKVVMITGASSGIGREFCLDLSRSGCRIIAAARRVDRLKSLCDEINGFSSSNSNESSLNQEVRAVAIELDVSANGSIIEAAVQKAWDAFGRIDALVNNAGVRDLTNELMHKNLGQISESYLNNSNKELFPASLSLKGISELKEEDSSMMAIELGPYKIRVNSISPGLFRSEITEGLMQKDWLHNIALRTIPLRTHGTSDPALTSVVRYLIHDSSEYVSGNIFIVEAGATLPGVPIFSSL